MNTRANTFLCALLAVFFCFISPAYSQESQEDEQSQEYVEEVVNVEAEQADEGTMPGDELTETPNTEDQMNNSN